MTFADVGRAGSSAAVVTVSPAAGCVTATMTVSLRTTVTRSTVPRRTSLHPPTLVNLETSGSVSPVASVGIEAAQVF